MTDTCVAEDRSPYALPDLREGTQRESRFLFWMSAVFLVFHFIRTFGNNFWGDDAYTANVVQHSVSEIIDIASTDAHSPFYYLIVKGFCEVFGYSDWTYQFSSYVPYLILMVLTLTLVRRWFGTQTAILMSVMLSAVPISVNYITEVRMYEWALLFVFSTTLAAYAFCQRQNVLNAVLLVIFGVMSAYIHLYSLLSAGMIALAVVAIMLLKRRFAIVIGACIAGVIAVIPLLDKARYVFDSVSENFWIERLPYPHEFIGYAFGDVLMTIPAIFGFGFIVTVMLWELGKSAGPIDQYMIPKEGGRHLTQIGCLMILVLTPFVFTNLFGFSVSLFTRPVFVLKYAFSVLAGLWLLAGVCMTRFKPESKALIKFLAVLLVFAVPISGYNLGCEAVQCVDTADLLDATGDISGDNAITDYRAFSYSVLEFYYPGVQVTLVEDGRYVDHIDPSKGNWLFLEGKLSDEQRSEFESKGYSVETVRTDTHLAHYKVNVYQLVPM